MTLQELNRDLEKVELYLLKVQHAMQEAQDEECIGEGCDGEEEDEYEEEDDEEDEDGYEDDEE